MKKTALLTLVLALSFTGCSASEPEPEAVAQPEYDEVKYCEILGETFLVYQDVVTGVVESGDIDPVEWNTLSANMAGLSRQNLPTEWAESHERFASLFTQIKEGLDTGEMVNLQTTDYKIGMVEVMSSCDEGGFIQD